MRRHYSAWLMDAAIKVAVEEGVPEEQAIADFDEYLNNFYDTAYEQGRSDALLEG
jgi:hypothetical protein